MSAWTDQNSLFINLPTDQLLAIIAYGEASNQGADGMMAVINTVRNRTLDQSFYDKDIYTITGDTYKAVGLKQWQFSMFNMNDPVRKTATDIANNFTGYLNQSPALQQAYGLAQMALYGTLEDNTGGAQYYFNPADVASEPSWASAIPFLGQIGDHLFFGSGVSAAAESVVSTIEQTAGSAVEVFKKSPNVTVLVLAGLGVGVLLVMNRKKK